MLYTKFINSHADWRSSVAPVIENTERAILSRPYDKTLPA